MTFINDILTKVWLGLKSLKDERGQDLIEYALLGGLIAAAILLVTSFFTGAIQSMAQGIGNCIDFSDNTLCDPDPF
ncbi:MAG TPA: Flp family type IVb pilin [Dehalococcoidia bacterium]|nr:Flp family type IVb pilin [Dehalococcoidia bacterium]